MDHIGTHADCHTARIADPCVFREVPSTVLAGEFLEVFGRFNTRFATNSQDMPDEFPFSWTSATDCTFDAGIAIIGESGSGIYWVADED